MKDLVPRSRITTKLITASTLAMMAMLAVQGKTAEPTAPAPATSKTAKVPAPHAPLVQLSMEFAGDSAIGFKLLGSDARQQLLVTGADASGKQYDVTRD